MKLSGVPETVQNKVESDASSTPVKAGSHSDASSAVLSSMKSKGVAASSCSSWIRLHFLTQANGSYLHADNEETRYYLSWLSSNLDVGNRVNAEVVTKPEKATLGDLFSYMKQASAKIAWFECTATIDDVVHGSGWYYIGCGVCHTKATKRATTLMCKKCEKSEIVGVPQYLSKISVYDHRDQAVFVLLGDAGEELIGKKASELVEAYYQANESVGEEHIVPVPHFMIDTIGQIRKFIVKISAHNLIGKTQTLTVTKVLPLEAQEANDNLGVNVDEAPVNGGDDHADEAVKRSPDGINLDAAKRAIRG